MAAGGKCCLNNRKYSIGDYGNYCIFIGLRSSDRQYFQKIGGRYIDAEIFNIDVFDKLRKQTSVIGPLCLNFKKVFILPLKYYFYVYNYKPFEY